MVSKYEGFAINELQHILGSLMLAEKSLFANSPIIKPMIRECSEELDNAIKEFEIQFGPVT